jgi:hypothetical protein
VGVVLLLALLVHFGAHVAITVGLAMREPRWHALVGFLVSPLGAWWAARSGMRARVWVWAIALGVYTGTLAASHV